MRALIIDDRAKAAVARVLAHASKPENLYVVENGKPNRPPPGFDWRHVARLQTFKCVFSFTMTQGRIWRHLSISVPSEDYPHPAAAFMIAELFGFTGWTGESFDSLPADWAAQVNQDEHCVVLAQQARPAVKATA